MNTVNQSMIKRSGTSRELGTVHGYRNKKIRYHEEHSASVVLSWCRPTL